MHWKKSVLVIPKILRLFANTLIVDDKQLFQKQKKISEFFYFAFLKSILKFKHLPKKGDPHSRCVSGNTGCEKYGEINVQKALFQRTIRQRTQQMGQKSLGI